LSVSFQNKKRKDIVYSKKKHTFVADFNMKKTLFFLINKAL